MTFQSFSDMANAPRLQVHRVPMCFIAVASCVASGVAEHAMKFNALRVGVQVAAHDYSRC